MTNFDEELLENYWNCLNITLNSNDFKEEIGGIFEKVCKINQKWCFEKIIAILRGSKDSENIKLVLSSASAIRLKVSSNYYYNAILYTVL